MNINRLVSKVLFAVAILLGSVLSSAQGQSPIVFKNEVFKEQVVINSNGEEVKQRVEASLVVPGETVVYVSTFTNQGQENIENVEITNPVPADTIYIDFTAKGEGSEISFSVDGGSNYAAPSALTVVDANGARRRAKASDYTHIRWVYTDVLAPSDSGQVEFKARLK